PSQAKRLAPDFAFHPQVYRANGESEKLPPGEYTIEYTRGREYIAKKETVRVTGKAQTVSFKLERWIDPSKFGWWSGDHHIRAAVCTYPQPRTNEQGMVRATAQFLRVLKIASD